MTFQTISKNIIDEVGQCELCGSKRKLEVHHIIPRTACRGIVDADDEDNLICLCEKCHTRLTPRRFLQHYGIVKVKQSQEKMLKFYRELIDKNGECVDVIDLVERI